MDFAKFKGAAFKYDESIFSNSTPKHQSKTILVSDWKMFFARNFAVCGCWFNYWKAFPRKLLVKVTQVRYSKWKGFRTQKKKSQIICLNFVVTVVLYVSCKILLNGKRVQNGFRTIVPEDDCSPTLTLALTLTGEREFPSGAIVWTPFKTIFIFLTFIICFHKGSYIYWTRGSNNFLEQVNPSWDCIVSKKWCFQPIVIRNREKKTK